MKQGLNLDAGRPSFDGVVPAPITISRLAFTGIATLITREAAIKILSIVGGIVLARALTPSVFGLFAIANVVLSVFGLFAELGLGAAFIRRKQDAAVGELNALFTFQLVVTTALSLAVFLGAPAISAVYHEPLLAMVLRALAIGLVLGSLRTVPTIMCERSLRYGPVVLADVSGQLSYWSIAVGGALLGWGVWSLVVASLFSGGLPAAVLCVKTGWRPSVELNWVPLRDTLRFGAFYQGQSVTHFVKDAMITALGGLAYGSRTVGYLWWAQQLAAIPLQLTALVSRVSYPALSRLQDDGRAFSVLLERTLSWTCRSTFPVYAVLVGLSPEIIRYVYGPKWLPALPALYVFLGNMILGVVTGLLMPAIYSTGRAGSGLAISVGWTVITWGTAAILIGTRFGSVGIAWAYLIGTLAATMVIASIVRRISHIRLVRTLALPTVSAVGAGTVLHVVAADLIHGISSLVLLGASAVAVGLAVNFWSDRRLVVEAVRSLGTARTGGLSERDISVGGATRP